MKLQKRTLLLSLIFLLGIFSSCEFGKSEKENKSFNDNVVNDVTDTNSFKWVEGVFEFDSDNGIYTEKWKKVSNTEFTGIDYFLLKTDTLFKMKMRLYKVDDDYKMSYIVNGQNEGKESNFTLTSISGNEFVFENPFRTFPTIMKYKFSGDSVIEVSESGFENNKEKRKEFVLTKVKKQLFF